MRTGGSHLRTTANADGAVILDIEAGKISTLNSTGARVWLALEKGQDLNTIAMELANETGEQIEEVKKDIKEFVTDLQNQNLAG